MTIYNGRGAMPMFAHTFNDSEYNALINYVMSLRKY